MDQYESMIEEGEYDITPQEERELQRVYDYLSNYNEKKKMKKKINEKENDLRKLENDNINDSNNTNLPPIQINYNQNNNMNNSSLSLGIERNENEDNNDEINNLKNDINNLKNKLYLLETSNQRKISSSDLYDVIKHLGIKISKKEIEEMVWEVDEDLDGFIDWNEFKLMFHRNITDETGLEPSKLYNLVQFMVYDHNSNGLVSVDETMSMLYARYGRQTMETKLRELFGEAMRETGTEGGEINFEQYLEAVERTQYQTFLNTSAGKISSLRKKRKNTLSSTL